MARFASDYVESAKVIFYDDLDTVRFADDIWGESRKAQAIVAMGNVMMGMLAGNFAPVLSQAQSFDNQLLLTLLSPGGRAADREDRLAFLQLTRAGFVRVGVTEVGLGNNLPSGERYSLINLLRTSLSDAEFVLSGWPELNNDLELRREVLGCLDRAPGGRMSAAVPSNIAARIEGLREFDRNLRQSPIGIIVVSPAGIPLEPRVQGMLQSKSGDSDAVHNTAAEIVKQAGREGINLNSRSGWYRLIERMLRSSSPEQTSALHVLRDIVNLNYNAMVSESIRADGMSLSARHEYAADAAAGEFSPGEQPGKRWAELIPSSGKGNWLRWSDVPELLSKLQVLSPGERLAEIEGLRSEQITKYVMEHSWAVSIKVALPGAVGTAVSGFTTSLITSATPGQAAGVGALTGVATLVAGAPGIRSFKMRRTAKHAERLRLRDERRTIRTGAASWLEKAWRRR